MFRKSGVRGATCSSICLCGAFLLALFAAFSPYWVYRYSYSFAATASPSTAVGTGPFVLSSSSGSWRCSLLFDCFVTSQWNYIRNFNDTLCTGVYYDNIGRFGFCNEEDGRVRTPTKIKQIEAIAFSTTGALLLASFLACLAPLRGRSTFAFAAALFAFAGSALACAAFSIAVTYDYYQQFMEGSGWYLPFRATGGCDSGDCLFLSERIRLHWGPAFWSMVAVFVIAFTSSCSLCATARALDQEDEGSYGKGAYGPSYDRLGGDYGSGARPGYGRETPKNL